MFKDLISSISSTLEGCTFNFPYKKAVNEFANSPVHWDSGMSSGEEEEEDEEEEEEGGKGKKNIKA